MTDTEGGQWRFQERTGKPSSSAPISTDPQLYPPVNNAPKAINTVQMRLLFNKKRLNALQHTSTDMQQLVMKMFEFDLDMIHISSTKDPSLTITKTSPFPSTEELFTKFFDHKSTNKSGDTTTITLLCNLVSFTTNPLTTIKRNKTFFDYTKENGIFIFPHKFKSISLSRVGFFSEKHPRLTNITDFTTTVSSMISYQQDDQSNPPAIPPFTLNLRHVIFTQKHDDGTTTQHSTDAIEVECEQEHLSTMTDLFNQLPFIIQEHGLFTPMDMQYCDPELFAQRIIDQENFIDRHTLLSLFGWHELVMQTHLQDSNIPISESILAIFGTIAVERTNTTDIDGKWFLVVDKHERNRIISHIETQIIPSVQTTQEHETCLLVNEKFASGLSVSRSARQARPSTNYISNESRQYTNISAAASNTTSSSFPTRYNRTRNNNHQPKNSTIPQATNPYPRNNTAPSNTTWAHRTSPNTVTHRTHLTVPPATNNSNTNAALPRTQENKETETDAMETTNTTDDQSTSQHNPYFHDNSTVNSNASNRSEIEKFKQYFEEIMRAQQKAFNDQVQALKHHISELTTSMPNTTHDANTNQDPTQITSIEFKRLEAMIMNVTTQLESMSTIQRPPPIITTNNTSNQQQNNSTQNDNSTITPTSDTTSNKRTIQTTEYPSLPKTTPPPTTTLSSSATFFLPRPPQQKINKTTDLLTRITSQSTLKRPPPDKPNHPPKQSNINNSDVALTHPTVTQPIHPKNSNGDPKQSHDLTDTTDASSSSESDSTYKSPPRKTQRTQSHLQTKPFALTTSNLPLFPIQELIPNTSETEDSISPLRHIIFNTKPKGQLKQDTSSTSDDTDGNSTIIHDEDQAMTSTDDSSTTTSTNTTHSPKQYPIDKEPIYKTDSLNHPTTRSQSQQRTNGPNHTKLKKV
jgi:hypothetical protein